MDRDVIILDNADNAWGKHWKRRIDFKDVWLERATE